jgi:hypothetical protein
MVMTTELEELAPFIGRWLVSPDFTSSGSETPHALSTFSWLEGHRFLIQRWSVEHPDAPDGIAIIGRGPRPASYVQHYFDSRGVSRVYEMGFDGAQWTLERFAEHPDFSQRFIGSFNESGDTIEGAWEISRDGGSTWTIDFHLTYAKAE